MFYTTAYDELNDASSAAVSWFTVQSVSDRRRRHASTGHGEVPGHGSSKRAMASRSPRLNDTESIDDEDGDKTPEARSVNASDDGSIDSVEPSSSSVKQRSPSSVDTAGGGSSGNAAWWSYDKRNGGGTTSSRGSSVTTHQSARYSLTGDRLMYTRSNSSTSAAGSSMSGRADRSGSGTDGGEPVWDLSDSLAELYENEQLRQAAKFRGAMSPSSSTAAGSTLPEFMSEGNQRVDVESWLAASPDNGFIRVYSAVQAGPGGIRGRSGGPSRLVPCVMSTTALKICLQLGISSGSLHVQYAGDSSVRRLEPNEQPLSLQSDYLISLGYDSVSTIQAAGVTEDLSYLIKFYAGKPIHDSTFSRRQLKSVVNVKKGGLLQQWVQRLCAISGTRLLIYKDASQKDEPMVIQLVKGAVEEVNFKGHELCLKLTSTMNGEKQIYLSFTDQKLYGRWLRRCKKATDKLPTVADLSNCQLEYLPENIFVNDQLAVLNLQHNSLRERPLDEDIYVIGWIEDLARFKHLRTLNIADNDLGSFPVSICSISTLVHLNVSSNKISEVPREIRSLKSLQELHLHNNHLTSLPLEISFLKHLYVLLLAFNRFVEIPSALARMTNIKASDMENIILAGNQIEEFPRDIVVELRHAKKIDLRLNCLLLPVEQTMHFSLFERLTHLDLRDNRVEYLDITGIKTLEYLNCERNAMGTLMVNGTALRNLFVSCNCIENLMIEPKPEWLLQIDVSDNCLESLPEWLSECVFLQKISASKNFLTYLPRGLLTAAKLKYLRVDHNSLTSLPDAVDCQFLEELYIHHNMISQLPDTLLQNATKLRLLNASNNRLVSLPLLNPNNDLNKVQELYLSGNCLGNRIFSIISGYSRLKVLHLAQNELTELDDSEILKLEMLYELNVSTNQLSSLPPSLCLLPKLFVLRAHSNCLRNLPDFHTAKSLRVLDVGHNQLCNISVTNLMASQISMLDMSLNSELRVDPSEYKAIKRKKNVCLVDLTGQDRQLPGLGQKSHLESIEEHVELDIGRPWKVGFSETSGNRNKLCISTLKTLQFNSDNESLFGMFDGGRNSDVPKLIVRNIADVLRDEIKTHDSPADFMKHAMLTMHRKLRSTGQRLGASGVLIHIQRHAGEGQMNQFTLNVANVGDVEAVLCRRGEALMLTRKFVAVHDREEISRIVQHDGIITEDGKVNGTTICTRQLGCAYLFPHVIPDPFVASVTLRNDDEFIVVANGAVWDVVSPEDAIEELYEIGSPVVAAKHLQDLAQGYGALENVSVLVIRLNTDRGPSLARLRPNRQAMSVDDVEAAAAHEAAQQARRARALGHSSSRAGSRDQSGVHRRPSDRLQVPAAVRRISSITTTTGTSGGEASGISSTSGFSGDHSSSQQSSERRAMTAADDGFRSGSVTPQNMEYPGMPASRAGNSDANGSISSGLTNRMSFMTSDDGDENNDDDIDDVSMTELTPPRFQAYNVRQSGSQNQYEDDDDDFAQSITRVDAEEQYRMALPQSITSGQSATKKYDTAAAAMDRQSFSTVARPKSVPVSSSLRDGPAPPIAPKPTRFIKKNGTGSTRDDGAHSSTYRHHPPAVTERPAWVQESYSQSSRGYQRTFDSDSSMVSGEYSVTPVNEPQRPRPNSSDDESNVARMIFEDSATSTDDLEEVNVTGKTNRAGLSQPSQSRTSQGAMFTGGAAAVGSRRQRTGSRMHAADIFTSPHLVLPTPPASQQPRQQRDTTAAASIPQRRVLNNSEPPVARPGRPAVGNASWLNQQQQQQVQVPMHTGFQVRQFDSNPPRRMESPSGSGQYDASVNRQGTTYLMRPSSSSVANRRQATNVIAGGGQQRSEGLRWMTRSDL